MIDAFLNACQADIRNPLCYLLITKQLLRSLSEGACTPPDTSKSPPTAYCFLQLKQGTYLIWLNTDDLRAVFIVTAAGVGDVIEVAGTHI